MVLNFYQRVSKKRKETREQWWGVGPRSVHVMEVLLVKKNLYNFF